MDKTNTLIIMIIAIGAIFLFLILGFNIKIPYTAQVVAIDKVPVETTNIIYETQCDIEYKSQTVTEPTTENKPLKYSSTDPTVYCGGVFDKYCTTSVLVENEDTQGGNFKVTFDVGFLPNPSNDRSTWTSDSVYLKPGESHTFYRSYDEKYFKEEDVKVTIIPDQISKIVQKTSTKSTPEKVCKQVAKQVPTIKYEDKAVTKQEVRYKTLFESWGM